MQCVSAYLVSMHFITCVDLCYKSRTVLSPQRHPFTHLWNDPSPHHSLTPGTFQERYVHEIIQYVTLWNWPFSMSIIALTSSKLLLYQSSFPFYSWIIFHSMDGPQFIHPLKGVLVVPSLRILQLFQLWTLVYRYLCRPSFHFPGVNTRSTQGSYGKCRFSFSRH